MTPNNNQHANILHQRRIEIFEIINAGDSGIKEVIDDAVKMLMELDSIPGPLGAIKKTLGLWKNKRKRETLKKICNSILKQIFDPSREYKMRIADVRGICEAIGGTFAQEFNMRTYERLYDIIIQKLSEGSLREKCNDLEIEEYVEEKIADIKVSKTILSVGEPEDFIRRKPEGVSYGHSLKS